MQTGAMMRPSGLQWLGDIPTHWTILQARFVLGRGEYGISEPLHKDGEIGVLRMSDVGYGVVSTEDLARIDDVNIELLLSPGELLFNRTNSYEQVAKVGLFRGSSKQRITFASYLVRFRPTIDPEYLNYLLNSRQFLDFVRTHSFRAIGQVNLNPSRYVQLKICLPPIKEREAIVAFLNRETVRIDALVAKKRRLLELLEERRIALITHAVTKGLDPNVPMKPSGIDWLDPVPAHWMVLPLTRVVRKFVDYRGATPTKVSDGVPLITAVQIKNGRIDHSLDPVFITEEEYEERMTRGFPEKGDVLVTTEAPLGETAQIENERVAPGQRMIMMKPDPSKVTKEYLFAHFRSDVGRAELRSRASGSTASGIRADRLRSSKVLVPPLAEQIAITDYIESATCALPSIVAAIGRQIGMLNEYRSALITNAVTGKIDVRGMVEKEAAA